MRDLHNNITIDDTILPVVFTNSATPSAAEVDLVGCDSAELVIYIGASSLTTSNYMTFTLTHADDDGTGSSDSYTNVTTADMLGVTVTSGLILTADGETGQEGSKSYKFGYVGGKRFIKITPAETGSLPDTAISIHTVKGNLINSPHVS
jgi:hypothetical protein